MFVGLDLSPGNAAAVTLEGPSPATARIHPFQALDSKASFRARYGQADAVCERLLEGKTVDELECTVVCLEDYALGQSDNVSYQIAEVAALVKREIVRSGVVLIIVNPSKLKHFVPVVMGDKPRRGLNKNDIIAYARRDGLQGIDPKKPGKPGYYKRQLEDIADAYFLAKMAWTADYLLNNPNEDPPARHLFMDPAKGLLRRADLLFNLDPLPTT